MEQIERGDAKVLASIWGSTPSEMAYLAKKCEAMGFDGLELSV